MQKLAHYIDGEFVEPVGKQYLDNVEPATGSVYSQLPDGDERDVDRAVAAAQKAFPKWSALPAAERSQFMMRIADLIDANLEPLARAESIDSGKPIAMARSLDIPR